MLLPTLTASPALRGPPPAQHQPEIIKLIKPDTAHTHVEATRQKMWRLCVEETFYGTSHQWVIVVVGNVPQEKQFNSHKSQM